MRGRSMKCSKGRRKAGPAGGSSSRAQQQQGWRLLTLLATGNVACEAFMQPKPVTCSKSSAFGSRSSSSRSMGGRGGEGVPGCGCRAVAAVDGAPAGRLPGVGTRSAGMRRRREEQQQTGMQASAGGSVADTTTTATAATPAPLPMRAPQRVQGVLAEEKGAAATPLSPSPSRSPSSSSSSSSPSSPSSLSAATAAAAATVAAAATGPATPCKRRARPASGQHQQQPQLVIQPQQPQQQQQVGKEGVQEQQLLQHQQLVIQHPAAAPPSPPPYPEERLGGITKWHLDSAQVRETVLAALSQPTRITPSHFSGMGIACARHLDMPLLQRVLDTACRHGMPPSVVGMTNIAHAAAKARRWFMVAQILHQMRVMDIAPNDITFTAILSEMAKASQYSLIEDLFRTEGIAPNVHCYNALITGCLARAKHPPGSNSGRNGGSSRGSSSTGGANSGRQQQQQQQQQQDGRTPFRIEQMRAEAFSRAMGFYQDMLAAGVAPDGMTYASLVSACKTGRKDSVARAKEVLAVMQEAGVKPDTFCMNALMGVSNDARMGDETLTVFESMGAFKVEKDLISYNTAISACELVGKGAKALSLLREAEAEGCHPDHITYHACLSALGRDRSQEGRLALDLFREMETVGLQPSSFSYNSAISALTRSNMPAQALELFDEMPLQGVARDAYSCSGALTACARLLEWERAVAIIAEMERRRLPVSCRALTSAMNTCVLASRPEQAIALHRKIAQNNIRINDRTYKTLLDACAQAKLGKVAACLLRDMDSRKIRPDSGHLDAALLSLTNQADWAVEVLEVMLNRRCKASSYTFDIAIDVCRAAGDEEKEKKVMEIWEEAKVKKQIGRAPQLSREEVQRQQQEQLVIQQQYQQQRRRGY